MGVCSSEGRKLGKVDQVWFGTSVGGPGQSVEETCAEVRRGLLGRDVISLPCRVVEAVEGGRVRPSVGGGTVRDRPPWIA